MDRIFACLFSRLESIESKLDNLAQTLDRHGKILSYLDLSYKCSGVTASSADKKHTQKPKTTSNVVSSQGKKLENVNSVKPEFNDALLMNEDEQTSGNSFKTCSFMSTNGSIETTDRSEFEHFWKSVKHHMESFQSGMPKPSHCASSSVPSKISRQLKNNKTVEKVNHVEETTKRSGISAGISNANVKKINSSSQHIKKRKLLSGNVPNKSPEGTENVQESNKLAKTQPVSGNPAKKKKPIENAKVATKLEAKSKPKAASGSESEEVAKENKKHLDGSNNEPLIKKSKAEPPSDQDIKAHVKVILANANLEEITMKTVCRKVYDHYPDFDITFKKPLIKSTVKALIIDEAVKAVNKDVVPTTLFKDASSLLNKN